MGRLQQTIFIGLIGLLWLGAGARAEHGSPVLSDAGHNARWSVGPDGMAASIKGSEMERPTLSFSVKQLRRAALAVIINSDTKRVVVEVGGRSLTFEASGAEQTLVMDAGGEDPVVAFNGRAKAGWQQAWRAGLGADGAEEVTVRFAPCLFVKLTWQHGGGIHIPAVEGEAESAEAEAEGEAEDRRRRRGRRGAVEADPPDKRGLRGALVQLRIAHGQTGVVRLAPAVVVRRGGLAVTPLHPLVGATKVEAKLFDRAVRSPLPVSVVGFDKETDLALVRMDLSADPAARAALTPLSMAGGAPEKDAALWVAHRVGDELAMSGGPVKWAGPLGELGSRSRAKLGYPETTRWILIDAESDRRYGMRPVVNGRGELAGLAAWTWPMSGEVVAALGAEHVGALIAGSDLARGMRWAAVEEAAGGTNWPYAIYPSIDVQEGGKTAMLRRAIQVADRSHECERCEGAGHVFRQVTVGHRRVHGGLRRPMRADKAFVCPHCRGDGLEEESAVLGGLGTLAEAAAVVDAADPQAGEQLEAAAATLAGIGRKHFSALVKLSEARARGLIDAGPAAVGRPVALYGERVRAGRRSGLGGEAGLEAVRISDPTADRRDRYGRGEDPDGSPHAAVIDRVRHAAEGRGELVGVTGLLAGFVAREQGEPPLLILSGAVVAPIREGDLVERQSAEQWNEAHLPEVDDD